MDGDGLARDHHSPARGALHLTSAGGLPGRAVELPEGPLMSWRTYPEVLLSAGPIGAQRYKSQGKG